MLDVTVVGIGNAGNQIAALAQQKLNITTIAINSSDKDLETIPETVIKRVISNPEGSEKGAGKDRTKAKSYLKSSIMNIMDEEIRDRISSMDVVFVVSSTGGGTGSGAAPIVAELLTSMFPDVITIVVGILPVNQEALSAHVNTLQYLDEIFTQVTDLKYMLYDNDKYSNIASYRMMQKINEEIVKDIDVLRCTYNYTTPFDSIDSADMKRVLSFKGRLMVARLDEIKERDVDNKSIAQLLLGAIKNNAHAELNRDKKITSSGVIANLSESMVEDFDNHVPEICDYMGSPVHDFTHTCVTGDRKMPNRVFYIASGLSKPDDKISIISDRVNEIEEKQKIEEDENAIDTIDVARLVNTVASKDVKKENEKQDVDLAALFNKFGV